MRFRLFGRADPEVPDRCAFCHAEPRPSDVVFGDGRRSCALCASGAVHTSAAMRHIERGAVRWMHEAMGMKLGLLPWATVDVVDLDELAEIRGNDRTPCAGLMTGTWATVGNKRTPLDLRVLVLSGYSPRRTFTILVHELTHLWQAEYFPANMVEPILLEGFASWVEREACLDLGDHAEARTLLESDSPVYGHGLREVLRLQGRAHRRAVPAMVTKLAKSPMPVVRKPRAQP